MKRGGEQTSSECSGCWAKQSWLLHHVRHRGGYQRYCTSCVLKFHPGSFCSNCFDVFEGPPPADSLKCSKCPSVSHSACVGSDPLPSRYLCPTCSSPSFSFFNPLLPPPSSSSAPAASASRPVIDLTSAKVLLAAAMIAAQSMRKAAATARLEADRKVREAAFARKRAREALEKAAVVLLPPAKDKQSSHVVLSSGTAGLDLRKNAVANASVVTPAVAAQKRVQSGARPGNNNNVAPAEKDKSSLGSGTVQIQRPPRKNIEAKGSYGPPSELYVDENGREKGFPDSSATKPKLNQDASASKANSGIMLMGSQSRASLLS